MRATSGICVHPACAAAVGPLDRLTAKWRLRGRSAQRAARAGVAGSLRLVYVLWMSDFHGGFFVRSIDAAVAEPIRLALATALRARRIEPERNSLTFAVMRGCPVMHVAVRGPVADGKDYAFFHLTHSDLGAEVARAAGVEVWAYHYENQSGSESVRAFGPDGRERSNVSRGWDELAEELELTDETDDDEQSGQLFEAAPLGVLAKELGVARSLLDDDLGYGAETVRVPLTGDPCTPAVAAYLGSPLRTLDLAGIPEARSGGRAQTLYFSSWMIEEFEAHARRLEVSVGSVASAIWEAAKPDLFRTVPIVDADQPFGEPSSKPARFMAAPPISPPKDVVVPSLVPVFATALRGPRARSVPRVCLSRGATARARRV